MDDQTVLLERLLLRATMLELGRVAQVSEPLTLSQFFALLAAQRHEDGCSMGALAGETLLPPSTATSVVNRLVDLGLVERRRDEAGDRRQVLVRPTQKGKRLLAQVRQTRQADVERVLSTNGTADGTVELLRDYIDVLAETLYPEEDYPPRLFI